LLALFSQALAPIAHAQAQPSAADEIVADLKATFGDAFQLCLHVDDAAHDRSHAPNPCDDGCPLCGALSAPAALPPEGVVVPTPVATTERLAAPPTLFLPPFFSRASPAKPRAPPFEV
jgi:hypothetical protein